MRNLILYAIVFLGISVLTAQTDPPSKTGQKPAKGDVYREQDSTQRNSRKGSRSAKKDSSHIHAVPGAAPTNSKKNGKSTKPASIRIKDSLQHN